MSTDGNVGIGTTEPSGKFSVGSAAGENAYLFYDNANVGDAVDGQSLYVYRKAAEGNDYIKIFTDQYRQNQITTSSALYFTSGGSMWFNPAWKQQSYFGGGSGPGNVNFFGVVTAGNNPMLNIYGNPTGAAAKDYASLQIVGVNHNLKIQNNDLRPR